MVSYPRSQLKNWQTELIKALNDLSSLSSQFENLSNRIVGIVIAIEADEHMPTSVANTRDFIGAIKKFRDQTDKSKKAIIKTALDYGALDRKDLEKII